MNKFKTVALTILIFVIATAFAMTIELETKSLLDNKIELKIPKAFRIMPEEMIKIKYPSERRPTLVYSNESGGINVALNLTVHEANQDNISTYKDNFVTTFKSMYPTSEWIGNGVNEINGRQVGYLELITPAFDAKIYNLIFFTHLDGKLLMCTFNCTKKDMTEWAPVAREIMNSLNIPI